MKRIIRITESDLHFIIKKIIKEDVILLRKLVYKSKINFGQYKGQTVEEVMRLGKNGYLRYLYYNVEGISFIDEILKKIGVIGNNFDYSIKKPGKDPDMGKEINDRILKHLSLKQRSHIKKILKAKETGKYISDKAPYSKGNLQRWNQGH